MNFTENIRNVELNFSGINNNAYYDLIDKKILIIGIDGYIGV